MYILDYRLRILHYDIADKAVRGRRIDDFDAASAIRVSHTLTVPPLPDTFIFDRTDILETAAELPGLGSVIISYDPKAPAFRISNPDGKYLTLDREDYLFDRDECHMWEYYWIVDDDFIEKMKHFLGNSWISARDGKLYGPERLSLSENFNIQIGPYAIDLRLQVASDFGATKIIGIVDGWKPEQFYLYRPLVYITAFSHPDVFGQLQICVRSLRDIGGYTGAIVVMTDESRSYISEICDEPFDRIDVDELHPTDFVGFVCSKYGILDNPKYSGYQPVMYLDPDIVFDRPVDPMLIEATVTQKICAPLEVAHPLQTHPPVGGTLLQLDHLDAGPFAAGMNGGTIVVPNTSDEAARAAFRLVARTLTNIGMKFGRRWCAWADQEALNYVSFKIAGINTAVLTKYARFIDRPTGAFNSGAGFVHFWGHSAAGKVVKMRAYLADLYAGAGIDRVLPRAIEHDD